MTRIRLSRLVATASTTLVLAAGCVPGPTGDNLPQATIDAPVGTTVVPFGSWCFNESLVFRIEAPSSWNSVPYGSEAIPVINGRDNYYPLGGATWTPVPDHPEVSLLTVYIGDGTGCFDIKVRTTRVADEPDGRIRLTLSTMGGYVTVTPDRPLERTICASGRERLQLKVTGRTSAPPATYPELRSGSTVISGTWTQHPLAPDINKDPTLRTFSTGVVPKGCYTIRWATTTEPQSLGFGVEWQWVPDDWFPPE